MIYSGNLENEWVVWNKIVNNWSAYMKKKPVWIRVRFLFAVDRGGDRLIV